MPSSNLFNHLPTATGRDGCTFEHIAERRVEPLVRHGDSAAVLVVDPAGVKRVGSRSAVVVIVARSIVGGLLSGDHLSSGAAFGRGFAEELVDGFHLRRCVRLGQSQVKE